MRRARIIGTGMYLPPVCVSNEELAEKLGKSLSPILESQNGIFHRYVTGNQLSSADLAVEAGKAAVEAAGIQVEQLDLVIIATDTPEYITPPTASVVQGRIGAIHAGTFDLNGACSGFVAALDVASRMIGYGNDYNNILVVGTYNMTKYSDPDDTMLAPLFSDGAGAVVLQATEQDAGFLSSQLYADGTTHDYFGVFAGGSKQPITQQVLEKKEHLVQIRKLYTINVNKENWPRLIHKALAKAHLTVSDVDHIIFTQVSRSNIEVVMENLGLPMEKTTCIMDQYGYTGSACIPMALHTAVLEDKILRGDIVALIGSGVGIAIAVTIFKW